MDCRCNSGFYGDGVTCEACAQNARSITGPLNVRSCTCNTGFGGDATTKCTCEDHDPEVLTWSGMGMTNVRTPVLGTMETDLLKLHEPKQQLQPGASKSATSSAEPAPAQAGAAASRNIQSQAPLTAAFGSHNSLSQQFLSSTAARTTKDTLTPSAAFTAFDSPSSASLQLLSNTPRRLHAATPTPSAAVSTTPTDVICLDNHDDMDMDKDTSGRGQPLLGTTPSTVPKSLVSLAERRAVVLGQHHRN